ncbi:MAG TPA: alpha/beta hydrolase [Symbiobacteriaceae bacterium]|nr:alpha/beta hydrolase [Symbiobacteriaceae bacterium]
MTGRLIDMGGYRLHVTDRGSGGPAVVVLHGAGESSYSWFHVGKAVSGFTRIVTYDRPGLGASDPGPGLDPVRSVEELDAVLAKAGVPAPYVLVGHSIGGILARLYAIRYPERVAGMVMVDSSHEALKDDPGFRKGFAMTAAVLKVMRALARIGLPRFLIQPLEFAMMYPERRFYAGQISPGEYRDWAAAVHRNLTGTNGVQELGAAFPMLEAAAAAKKDGQQFGSMPMVVLTNPGFGQAWIEMHRELAARSANSVHRITDHKGHNIQMPRPELVIDAIREVVEQVRDRVDKAI